MKKVFAILTILSVLMYLCACSTSTDKTAQETPVDNASSDVPSALTTEDISATENATNATVQQEAQQEYVETIFIYAEEGAVVTWFDSKTGEFDYKWKCEMCGKTQNGETRGHQLTHNGSEFNGGFVCTNSSCSMWGKGQKLIIGCEVRGEWVTITD